MTTLKEIPTDLADELGADADGTVRFLPAARPPVINPKRLHLRRRRDLTIHLMVMRLRLGFDKGLPYEVLRDITDELGELIEGYQDDQPSPRTPTPPEAA